MGQYEPLQQEQGAGNPARGSLKYGTICRAVIGSILVTIVIAFSASFLSKSLMKTSEIVKKQGAGCLFLHEDKCLLLLRNSKHNNNTWGLPGGNVEAQDTDLLQTATREGTEEMGSLPEFSVLGEIKTRRGKSNQKAYSVFVCGLQDSFVPTLNEEHTSHQWVQLQRVVGLQNLHPVVSLIFSEPYVEELAAVSSQDREALAPGKKPKKLGAGLFFVSQGEVLLLTRNSSHNNATLSVPGGNVDLEEKELLETAEREAVEEMGSCPKYTSKGVINTWRGKHDQKEFKIFLAEVSPDTKASFRAKLDHESLDWGWYPLADLSQKDLHPVVKILITDHLQEIKTAFGLP